MYSGNYTYEITGKDDDGVRHIEIKRSGVIVDATRLPPRKYVEAARNVFDVYVEEHGIAAEVPTATD